MSPAPRRARALFLCALLALAALMVPLAACQVVGPFAEPEPSLFGIAAELAQRRADSIERLRAYRVAGVYPRNRVVPGMANIFIDEDQHLCAVANLMWLDGRTEMVEQAAASNNLVVLRDVHEGPLYDWILGSGLTQEEIARIQAPYVFMPPDDPNLIAWEDQRLDDHFEVVEQELQANNAAAILEAARRQRAEILAPR